MTFVDSDSDKEEFYWRLHYKNVNRSEIRMMKLNPKVDWARFADRISKKINITADKAFPLRYYNGENPNPNPNTNSNNNSNSNSNSHYYNNYNDYNSSSNSSSNPSSNQEDGSISVDDDEDYSICSIIMKSKSCSKNPEKGFDLYTKQ